MNQGIQLYQSIIARPDDMTLRLVYADWLDENGQSERADYIRYGIANPAVSDGCQGDASVGLFCPNATDKTDETNSIIEWCPTCAGLIANGVPASFLGENNFRIRCGFLDEVICVWSAFRNQGKRLVRCAPLRHVCFMDKRPMLYQVHNTMLWRWAYRARSRFDNSPLRDYEIDKDVFELLNGQPPGNWHYPTALLALEDLSDACLKWARKS